MPEAGLNRLGGKSAVVTGAAEGIGRATAELFAREGAKSSSSTTWTTPI